MVSAFEGFVPELFLLWLFAFFYITRITGNICYMAITRESWPMLRYFQDEFEILFELLSLFVFVLLAHISKCTCGRREKKERDVRKGCL